MREKKGREEGIFVSCVWHKKSRGGFGDAKLETFVSHAMYALIFFFHPPKKKKSNITGGKLWVENSL